MYIEVNNCPQCGAPAKSGAKKCEYCDATFIVNTLSSLSRYDSNAVSKYLSFYKNSLKKNPDSGDELLGLGLAYLSAKNYTLSIVTFEKLITVAPDNPSAYYLNAISQIAGRRIMTLSIKEARSIEELLITALQIDPSFVMPKIVQYFFREDFYARNGLRSPEPTSKQLLIEIGASGVPESEYIELMKHTKVPDNIVNTGHIVFSH